MGVVFFGERGGVSMDFPPGLAKSSRFGGFPQQLEEEIFAKALNFQANPKETLEADFEEGAFWKRRLFGFSYSREFLLFF